MRPRITLIHAIPISMPPILEAFTQGWPEAEVASLLDDDLLPALGREGGLTPHIVQRICDLAAYAARAGADGILFTCSAFTPAMDAARRLVCVPLLKPDEAMVAAAVDAGTRIGVVATFPATIPLQEEQLRASARGRGLELQVRSALAAGAMEALSAGDAARHDQLVGEAAGRLAGAVDVICLAQFSMSRARPAVQARVAVPVLTAPETAVARLKALLGG